jgi:hypothetical protein
VLASSAFAIDDSGSRKKLQMLRNRLPRDLKALSEGRD